MNCKHEEKDIIGKGGRLFCKRCGMYLDALDEKPKVEEKAPVEEVKAPIENKKEKKDVKRRTVKASRRTS